ncbi:MAG: hypothetical protein HKM24_04890 [Gammaproteobacteria bacterium]|nr:hypothetical protein [Gammaproteobacteria bacterium]
MPRVYKNADMFALDKHQIQLKLPEPISPQLNLVLVECERGHYQEFSLADITFVYIFTEGKAVFLVNDKPHLVQAGDILALPPDHRLWYAGKFKAVLACAPAFDDAKETHHRFVESDEIESAWAKHLTAQ